MAKDQSASLTHGKKGEGTGTITRVKSEKPPKVDVHDEGDGSYTIFVTPRNSRKS